MPVAHISIGSNIGDRLAQIEQAVACIKKEIDCSLKKSAPFYSSPEGFDSNNEFINVGIMLKSELDPFDLLRKLQDIEHSIDPSPHRDTQGNYIDRKIDIDLIAYGEWEIKSDRLTIPHPHMHSRKFVMVPLLSLEPSYKNKDALG